MLLWTYCLFICDFYNLRIKIVWVHQPWSNLNLLECKNTGNIPLSKLILLWKKREKFNSLKVRVDVCDPPCIIIKTHSFDLWHKWILHFIWTKWKNDFRYFQNLENYSTILFKIFNNAELPLSCSLDTLKIYLSFKYTKSQGGQTWNSMGNKSCLCFLTPHTTYIIPQV